MKCKRGGKIGLITTHFTPYGMKYKHISQEEREQIFFYLQEGEEKSEIARKLGRHPSTIGREIARNSTVIDRRNNNNPREKKKHYLPDKAEGKYKKRRKESKSAFPLKNPFIYRYAIEHLKEGWTPEQISGRLSVEYQDRHSISHECIYQFIYSKKGKGMNLSEYLPRHHKKRRKWKGRKSRKGKIIPNRVSIHKRPEEI